MKADLTLTKHVTKRIQHRAIPEKVINWLLEFGHRIYQQGDYQIYHFHSRVRKEIRGKLSLDDRRLFDKKRDVYVILSGESIMITAGYRYKGLPRC